MDNGGQITLRAVRGLPLIGAGEDLAEIIVERLRANRIRVASGDVLVIAQKVVSKAEDRYVRLDEVSPTPEASALAEKVRKDPRLVQVILSESKAVVRAVPGVLIVEHRLGFIMANAGIDQSNVDHSQGERVLLLPKDPDAAAASIKRRIDVAFDADTAVVINDSFGRPWRRGIVGVALGAAGLPAIVDLIGTRDLFDRPMQVTQTALADELAAAASLLMGQGAQGLPVVHVRGVTWDTAPAPASELVRPRAEDLFR